MNKKKKLLQFLLMIYFVLIFTGGAYAYENECPPHEWGPWYTYEESTCVTAGEMHRDCNNCWQSEIQEISATGIHVWSDWQTDSYPTCGDVGEMLRYCDCCSKLETKEIPSTGKHEWDDWYIDKEATISRTGIKSRECWECGQVQQTEIPTKTPFIKLNKSKVSVAQGKTYQLKVKMANGDKIKSCKTSNSGVATVTKKGTLKCKRAGKANITIILVSGKKAVCKVTVTAPKRSAVGVNGGAGGTVYWVPSGSVYHRTSSCPTLSRSHTVCSGSIGESGKPRGCKVCY